MVKLYVDETKKIKEKKFREREEPTRRDAHTDIYYFLYIELKTNCKLTQNMPVVIPPELKPITPFIRRAEEVFTRALHSYQWIYC